MGGYPLLARWISDFDCELATQFWYIIRTGSYEIEQLSKSTRKHIRQAFKKCYVRKIEDNEIEKMYSCYQAAYKRYEKADNFRSFNLHFVQDNQSMSTKGVLRGLHFQKQYPQGKLVRVIRGSVFDVAVDLRANSRTYGQWYGVELTEKNKKQFYISEGFAHGFLVLSDMAEFCYKCTDFYHPGDEGGLAWNDPEIGITWPELKGEYNGTASGKGYTLNDGTKLNLSDKDQKWQRLKETFKF